MLRRLKALIVATVALLSSCTIPPMANAAAVAVATQGDVVVTVFDEPCAVAGVSNLPLRAAWVDGAGAVEGCVAVFVDAGVAAAYFPADGSIAIIPLSHFRAASGV